MFSYTIGLMFPANAVINTIGNQIRSPYPSTLMQPANNTGGLH
jgi:hypothetical protein